MHSFSRFLASTLLSLAAIYAMSQQAVIYTTTGSRSQSLTESYPAVTTSSSTNNAIILHPDRRNQSIDGYGFAFTYSACYNLLHMNKADRHALLERTFSRAKGYGVSYARISIGCSDFSSQLYSLCEQQGMEHFRLFSDETDYVIPVLKEILEINPDVKIMAAPWTCPRWMKVNNLTEKKSHYEWTDGHLNPQFYYSYSLYFVRFIQAMAEHGIRIYAVSPQNEPLNHGNCASLYMPWQEQAAFVRTLARTFKQQGIDTKIYVYDHNYNYDGISSEYDYPIKVYDELGSFEGEELVVGSAYHNYGGDVSELNDIHQQAPDKEIVFTEASIGEWNNGRNLDSSLMDVMKNVAILTTLNHARAACVWNFMLDYNKGPNLAGGCQTCYGAVDVANDYSWYTLNSQYYAICHMSAVTQPGAYRIDTEGWWTNNVSYVAFANPDGSVAMAFCNENGSAVNAKVVVDGKMISIPLPARSAVSCRWNYQVPSFNGSPMTWEGNGIYSFTGYLNQGEACTVQGRRELADDDWFYDPDFFSPLESTENGRSYSFIPVSGRYKVEADFRYGAFRVYPVDATGAPATMNADGSGALWCIGSTGIGKPLFLWNGANWNTGTEHDMALAQIQDKVYRISLVVGEQLNGNDVNFKFFHQPGWGGEYVGSATSDKPWRLSLNDQVFGVGNGSDGHDNGNIYARQTPTEGQVYVFTVDCSNPNAAVATVTDHIETAVNIPVADIKASVRGIFHVSGQYVGSNASRLPKGLYIVNGRKKLVK